MFFSDRFLIEWRNRRHFFTKSRPPPRKRAGRIGGVTRSAATRFLLFCWSDRVAVPRNILIVGTRKRHASPPTRIGFQSISTKRRCRIQIIAKKGGESNRIISSLKNRTLFSLRFRKKRFRKGNFLEKRNSARVVKIGWFARRRRTSRRPELWSVILCKARVHIGTVWWTAR